ncbi:MAG: hypothetical protein RQ736_07205 [Thiogranum sp.]|nr:hypothetical protein [Thiogranum sp.]
MAALDARIDYEASPEIREILARISRTEDVKLSPDNSRLAIADFARNRIFLFSIHIQGLENNAAPPRVQMLDYSVITSDSFKQPHGVTFLGNDHLLVCNRAADVCVYELPAPGDHPRERTLEPHQVIRGQGVLRARVKTPGSADCYALGDRCYRVLVCNNH